MAIRTIEIFEDDFDGSPAAETITYALGGQIFEIDLNKANGEKFKRALAPFIARSRRAGTVPPQWQYSRRAVPDRNESAAKGAIEERRAARAWAKKMGIKVADHGSIKFEILQAYRDHLVGSSATTRTPTRNLVAVPTARFSERAS